MHNQNPTAEYIKKFAEAQKTRNHGQHEIEKIMADLYFQRHVMDVQKPKNPHTTLKPVGSGEGGFAIDQRVAVLSGPLFLRVAPRGGSEAEKHASDKLEPFLNTALKIMEDDVEVRPKTVKHLLTFGIAFTLGPIPAPFFWADEEMEELIKKGDTDGIKEYRASHLPIVWRDWDPRNVEAKMNDRGEPAEVVYRREMYCGDIVDRWGDDALPAKDRYSIGPLRMGAGGYGDSEKIEVIDYVNTKYIATCVTNGKESTRPISYEHHMGMTPVVPFIGNSLPENEMGWKWAGILLHQREKIHALDETLTDLRTVFRDNVTAPPYVALDMEARSNFPGAPTEIDIRKEETVNLLKGEVAGRWPVTQMSIDGYQLMDRLQGNLSNQLHREGLSGTGPSGQSAVHLVGTNQISKQELQTYYNGLLRGYARVGKLLLRCPAALNAAFEYEPDEIVIRAFDAHSQSKEIAIAPKDAEPYKDLVSATLGWALPVNEGGNVTNFNLATKREPGGAAMYDPYTGREVFGNIQNPAEIDEKWMEYDLTAELYNIAKGIAIQRATGIAAQQGAAPIQDLLQRGNALPSFVNETLTQFGGAPDGGQEARTAANGARAGRGQQMSDLSAMPEVPISPV